MIGVRPSVPAFPSMGPGTLHGLANEQTFLNGIAENFTYVSENVDKLGSPWGYNHYPVGWAHGKG